MAQNKMGREKRDLVLDGPGCPAKILDYIAKSRDMMEVFKQYMNQFKCLG